MIGALCESLQMLLAIFIVCVHVTLLIDTGRSSVTMSRCGCIYMTKAQLKMQKHTSFMPHYRERMLNFLSTISCQKKTFKLCLDLVYVVICALRSHSNALLKFGALHRKDKVFFSSCNVQSPLH